MFYGNKFFKPVQLMNADHTDIVGGKLTLPDGATLLRAGSLLGYKASTVDEFAPVDTGAGLIGWLTQGMDADGLTIENFAVTQNPNYNLKSGQEVSIRKFRQGDEFEIEGKGAAAYGNLLATSSTGAVSSGTTRGTQLAAHKGGLRVAQTGDLVQFEYVMNLTPLADNTNVRCHVRYIGGGHIVPAPAPSPGP